jgi:hypothetical protein
MLSSDEGWAVGAYGQIFRWNGYEWASVQSPTLKDLNSNYTLSSYSGWAVGDEGTILHWDGNKWSEVESPTSEDLWSVFMVSQTDGWIVGSQGTILRYGPQEILGGIEITLPLLIIAVIIGLSLSVFFLRKRKLSGEPITWANTI